MNVAKLNSVFRDYADEIPEVDCFSIVTKPSSIDIGEPGQLWFGNSICISSSFIEIVYFYNVQGLDENNLRFIYKIRGQNNKDYEIIPYNKGKFDLKILIKSIRDKGVIIDEEDMFIEACLIYLKAILKEKDLFNLNACGWYIASENQYQYAGVTVASANSKISESLLKFNDSKCVSPNVGLTDNWASFMEVFQIVDNSIAYPLLAYLALSFSYPFIKNAVKIQSKPLICLCSRNNNMTCYSAANIIMNMFNWSNKYPYNIKRLIHISLESSTSNILSKANLINHCPIFIISKTHKISVKRGTGKKLACMADDPGSGFFPLFLSDNEILCDNMINLNLSGTSTSLESLHLAMDNLASVRIVMWHFIKYLSSPLSIFNSKTIIKHYWKESSKNLYSTASDENKLASCVLLLTALKLFIEYLSHIPGLAFPKEAIIAESITIFQCLSKNSYLPLNLSDDYQSSVNPISEFARYIKNIFIDRSYSVSYEHWTGKERNGGKDECFYLEYEAYFKDFSQACPDLKNHNQRDFERLLFELGIILRKDQSSFYKRKTLDHVGINALVVKKDSLTSLFTCTDNKQESSA